MASSLHKFQFALKMCEEHDKKELHAYCKTCKKKICTLCIKMDHTTHDWETITDIIREKKRSLPEVCKEIRATTLSGLRNKLDRFDEKMREQDAGFEATKTILNCSRKSYIYKIDQLFDRRIDACRQNTEDAKRQYKEKREGLKKKVDSVEVMTHALDRDIHTLPDHDILDMEKEMRDELEKVLSYSAEKYTCKSVFVPGKMNAQALGDMIGESHRISLEEKHDIDRYSKYIFSLHPVSETSAFVKVTADGCLILLDRTGQELKTMKTSCRDFTISNTGECILIDENKCIFSVFTQDDVKIRTFQTKPLHPTTISRANNGDILGSFFSGGAKFNPSPTSRRILRRMNLKGEVLQTYEFGEDDKTRLFMVPGRATESMLSDICVVNWLSDRSGDLVVLYKDGRLKFTYKGQGLKSQMIFPIDVEYDSQCNILFTEMHTRGIHMLSSEGVYLCTLCQYQNIHPYVIAIYDNNLWCGFLQGRVKVLKYDVS
ncbi:hypothetical protein FSP39_006583 [Pinctada imbricata]|uniref:B box-type domain-containing protein n=1 Tax=Pinctada imbricata TaxID=66713 RepID=A0AA88YHJ3_PINIB|nr:hypothetical protein FSP39_006583 [Pinctada imbricata]